MDSNSSNRFNRALLQKLADAYAHGTFDDKAYRELMQTVSPDTLTPLEQALDQFDFDSAATIIRSWIDNSAPEQEV